MIESKKGKMRIIKEIDDRHRIVKYPGDPNLYLNITLPEGPNYVPTIHSPADAIPTGLNGISRRNIPARTKPKT